MKTKTLLVPVLVLFGLAAAATGAFFLGELLSGSEPEQVFVLGDPPLATLKLPSQTMNGITARLESYYADANRLIVVIHIDGGEDDYFLGNISLTEGNAEISDSCEVQRLSSTRPVFAVDMVTARPVEGERLNGQLIFEVVMPDGEDTPLADFRFDLDLPVTPPMIFYPEYAVSANGIEILLDRVVMTPAFTQVYLCYDPPTDEDWGVSSGTIVQVNSQTSIMQTYNLLFDDKLAGMDEDSGPGWSPPVKEGRCVKIGFRVGGVYPRSLILTIPALERLFPPNIPEQDLAAAYKELQAQGINMEWHQSDHVVYAEYKKLPEGMTEADAFHQFAQALGYIYPGTWVFDVPLDSQSSKK